MYSSSAQSWTSLFSPTLFFKVSVDISSYLQLLCYKRCSPFPTELWYLNFENWCIALISVDPLPKGVVKDWKCPVVLISPYWEEGFCLPSVMGNVAKRLCFDWRAGKAFLNQGNCVWWSWSFLFPSPFVSLPECPFLMTFCCLLGRNWDYFDITAIISYLIFHLQNLSVSVSGSPLPTWCLPIAWSDFAGLLLGWGR